MNCQYCILILIYSFLMKGLNAVQNVSFDESMIGHITGYQANNVLANSEWQLLKSLYEDYQNKKVSQECYIIPKTIHFIWLGSPLPARAQEIVNSWKNKHPDWSIKIWTGSDVEAFSFQNRKVFDRAQNYAEKSDIWRYEILYQFGGVYADTDFECLESFDDLHTSCEFYTGIAQEASPALFNALIGSRAGHLILKALIDNIVEGPGDNDSWRILKHTGPHFFTRIFLAEASKFISGTVVAFPTSFFYPFPGSLRYRKDFENIKRQFAKLESKAIHYFDAYWQN